MNLAALMAIAAGLSMDAFAVSVTIGLSFCRSSGFRARPLSVLKAALTAGIFFGGFQFLMPVAGYLLGSGFAGWVNRVDHWIVFLLLSLIGIKMIKESFSKTTAAKISPTLSKMLLLSVATSIDALAVGVSFAFLETAVIPAAALIGCVTFAFSAAGVKIGELTGSAFRTKAELAGGVILIAAGVKILSEHLA